MFVVYKNNKKVYEHKVFKEAARYVVRDVEYEANYLLKTDCIDPEVYDDMVYNLYASVVHLQGFRWFEMPHRWDIKEE